MLLCLLVFLPLVVGLILLGLQKRSHIFALSLVTTALLTAASVGLMAVGAEDISLPLLSQLGVSFHYTAMGGLYALLSAALWLVALVVGRDCFSGDAPHMGRYYASLLITLSGVLGVFLAADLFTLFVFFEIMSFTSYLWVIHSQRENDIAAGASYLSYGVLGGLSMLFGIFLLYGLVPDLSIEALSTNFAPYVGSSQLTAACALLFVGFGAKAGAFFLHDWLPVSYVAAPAPATALLSGLLSKAGVYGILLIALRLLAGWEPFALFLLAIALLNMLVGGLCALTTSNLKRLLAFSSISQIGFILWGTALTSLLGEHGAIAAYGTAFHMVNHTLIKVLLFSLVGLVYATTHTLDMNQLQGFGRNKPWLHALFVVGGLSVAGIPGLSGYISKTLLHEAVVEYVHLYSAPPIFTVAEYLFLLAGGCTLAYMLKLYLCLFWEGDRPTAALGGRLSQTVLSLLAVVLVVLGCLPHLTFDVLGDQLAHFMGVHAMEGVAYFSLTNLSGSLCSIAFGLALFFADRLLRTWCCGGRYPQWVGMRDTIEWLIYRPVAAVLSYLGGFCARILDVLLDTVVFIASRTAFAPLTIPDSFYHGDSRNLKLKRPELHITYSLAYSLLMFGLGFLFTVISLLILGGTA